MYKLSFRTARALTQRNFVPAFIPNQHCLKDREDIMLEMSLGKLLKHSLASNKRQCEASVPF